MIWKQPRAQDHRVRKLEIAERHRRRAQNTNHRPIVDVLELKLETLSVTDFTGDREIYGQLIAHQRFLFEGKVRS